MQSSPLFGSGRGRRRKYRSSRGRCPRAPGSGPVGAAPPRVAGGGGSACRARRCSEAGAGDGGSTARAAGAAPEHQVAGLLGPLHLESREEEEAHAELAVVRKRARETEEVPLARRALPQSTR